MKGHSLFEVTLEGLILSLFVVLLGGFSFPLLAQSEGRPRLIVTKTTPKPVPSPAATRTPKNTARKVAEAPKSVDYCAAPFFFCPDAGEIQAILLENNDKLSKGKFEKTQDWEARKLHLLDEIRLSEDITMGSAMTFLYVLRTDAAETVEPAYDADKEQWSFELQLEPGPDGTTCLPILSRRSKGSICLVVLTDLSKATSAVVDMPIADAESNDGALQIAFHGRVMARDVYSHAFKVWGFFFDLAEIVCVNPKTGEMWGVKLVYSKPDSDASVK